jgi:hypothetical protein
VRRVVKLPLTPVAEAWGTAHRQAEYGLTASPADAEPTFGGVPAIQLDRASFNIKFPLIERACLRFLLLFFPLSPVDRFASVAVWGRPCLCGAAATADMRIDLFEQRHTPSPTGPLPLKDKALLRCGTRG